MIAIECFGVPRRRAQTASMHGEASTVDEALRERARLCSALEDSVLRQGTLRDAGKLSLNGERFVSDQQTPLNDGDILLLLSADVGGRARAPGLSRSLLGV
jgi:hypothetical protein